LAETNLSSSALVVQAALEAHGLTCQVVELPASTRTAQDAAQAVGTTVAQIVKTIVFKGQQSQQALLALASGVNRVSEERLAALAGEPILKADADFVRKETGFVIGGVPPLGHNQPLRTWIDEDLLQFSEVWAAAGNPHAVFRVNPLDLINKIGAVPAVIKA
jgi:prolyl-tRNA editing enzyme YbaK/EbsC (Cys-tRNA(Pro) deacylase)